MNDELEEVEYAWSQNEKEVEGVWSQKEVDIEDGSGQSAAPMEATLLHQARMARLFLDICTGTLYTVQIYLISVTFIFVCKHTQLDEGKYDLCHLFALYKDSEYDRSSHSLCLCTKGMDRESS
jgi:hypothetical protein